MEVPARMFKSMFVCLVGSCLLYPFEVEEIHENWKPNNIELIQTWGSENGKLSDLQLADKNFNHTDWPKNL